MSEKDFYEILGVSRSASNDEIKRAYRKLAKKYHPDRNPDNPQAESKFKEVSQAYGVLRDKEKRAKYNRYGEVGVGQWSNSPHGQKVYQWGGGSSVNIDDLEDLFSTFGGRADHTIFEDLFGGGVGASQRRTTAVPQRGRDQEHPVHLTFEQAVHGTTLTLQQSMVNNGRKETIEVKIPPGVDQGQKIRIAGRVPGHRGGPPGDLYLRCSIQPHPYFTREGSDIYVDVPVSVSEAVLGGKIEVPTLDGKVTMSLPPGTASGTRLRLKRKGVLKKGGSKRGDQYVIIKIVPPNELTDDQRRLFEELGKQDTTNPRMQCPWLK